MNKDIKVEAGYIYPTGLPTSISLSLEVYKKLTTQYSFESRIFAKAALNYFNI